jgi:NitT/TauT family transport system ATP-binding protein
MGLSVEIEGLQHGFFSKSGSEATRTLQDINIRIADGEFVVIVGPSGCGKTTLLNICAGLEPVQHGQVLVGGKAPAAGADGTTYVFAESALLPWRTALENVGLAMERQVGSKRDRRQRAREMLKAVGLADFEGSYRAQLSQGMRQRVALARALVSDPHLLFMDEPFAALDSQTRVVMQEELSRLLIARGATVLFVTHDLPEAVALADRVLVMSARPGTIAAEFTIDLPRPRDVIALRETPEYGELVSKLWGHLHSAVRSQLS